MKKSQCLLLAVEVSEDRVYMKHGETAAIAMRDPDVVHDDAYMSVSGLLAAPQGGAMQFSLWPSMD